MNIKHLIASLKELKKIYGDVDVMVASDPEGNRWLDLGRGVRYIKVPMGLKNPNLIVIYPDKSVTPK